MYKQLVSTKGKEMEYAIRNIKTQETYQCTAKGLSSAFEKAAKHFRWGRIVDYVPSGNDVYTLLRHTATPGEGNVAGRVYVAKQTS